MAEVDADLREKANRRHADMARADLEMNLIKIQCAKDEELQRVEAENEPKKRQAALAADLNKLEAVQQQARCCNVAVAAFACAFL